MTDESLIIKTLFEIKEDIGGIKKDVSTNKEHTATLVETVTRIDSKHNQDYLQYVKSREDVESRLIPLEKDLKARQEVTNDIKKKVWDITWDWGKMAIIFLAGYFIKIMK